MIGLMRKKVAPSDIEVGRVARFDSLTIEKEARIAVFKKMASGEEQLSHYFRMPINQENLDKLQKQADMLKSSTNELNHT